MWDNAVITNAGKTLLDSWVEGKVFRFEAAKGGTGTVSPLALMAQTALVNQRQTLSIISHQVVADGIRIHVQITAPTTGYTCNQIGIWGSVDGGAHVLLALYQDDKGVQIPAVSEVLDFMYTFFGTIAMSNTGNITLNIDASAAVSMFTFGEHVDDKSNPHHVTYQQVGAEAVGAVATHDSNASAHATGIAGNAASATKLKTARSLGNTMFDGGSDVTLDDMGAAKKSASVNCTLKGGTSWGGSGPFTQTVDVTGLGVSQNGFATLAQSVTKAQVEAATAAVLHATGQAAGKLTFTAFGDKPTIDIPISVTLLG